MMKKCLAALTLCTLTLTLFADKENYQKLFKEGEALRNSKKFAQAQEVFRKAFVETGITADQKCLSLMRSAQCDFWRGKYAEAISVMKEAVAMPGVTNYYKSDSYLWLADTYRAQKKWDDALAAYASALQFIPPSLPEMKSSALLLSGDCCAMKKDEKGAAAFYRQVTAMEKAPAQQKTRALNALVKSCFDAGEYTKAIEAAQAILNSKESNAADRRKAQKWIADSYFASQNFEQAKKELEKLKTMPEKE